MHGEENNIIKKLPLEFSEIFQKSKMFLGSALFNKGTWCQRTGNVSHIDFCDTIRAARSKINKTQVDSANFLSFLS